MLVYFDPWLAGVVLPTLIIVGLMAIPYIDTNPKGNGYYTFRERKWEIGSSCSASSCSGRSLIILGTFLRGPNWNFFGPFEYWDIHKLEPLVNIDLSEFIWVKALGMRLPNLAHPRDLRDHARAGLCPRAAGRCWRGAVQPFLREDGPAALLRRRCSCS